MDYYLELRSCVLQFNERSLSMGRICELCNFIANGRHGIPSEAKRQRCDGENCSLLYFVTQDDGNLYSNCSNATLLGSFP